MLNSDYCVPEFIFVCFAWFLYIITKIFNIELADSILLVDIINDFVLLFLTLFFLEFVEKYLYIIVEWTV